MKKKVTITFILISMLSCILIVAHTTATEPIDLSGNWDAIFIRMRPEVGNTFDTEKDIVKISQKGSEFVGICMIGGKKIGKNEEAIKGRLSGDKFEEAFISYADIITFNLSWGQGRATINDAKDLIVIYSFIESVPVHKTVVLPQLSEKLCCFLEFDFV